MSRQATWSPEQAPLLTQNHDTNRPQTASPYVGCPPISPPPTSPLPLLPISASSVSSLHSSTPPPRPARALLSSSRPQPRLSPPRSFRDRLQGAIAPTDGIVRLDSPVGTGKQQRIPLGSVLPGIVPDGVPKRSRQLFSGGIVHHDGADQQNWQPPTVLNNGANTEDLSGQLLEKTSRHANPTLKRKRRSAKTPKRAIARSALYVPSTETLPTSIMMHDTPPLEKARKATPFHFDDILTSLPAWPNSWSLRSASATKINENIMMQKGKGKAKAMEPRFTNMNHEHSSSNTPRPGTVHGDVSFRPVVDSEQHHHRRKVSSLADFGGTHHNVYGNNLGIRGWCVRYKKRVWLTITVTSVTLATGGILTGILWKLTHT